MISRFGDIAPAEGFFSKLTRRVQKHPALVTIACLVVLLAVGSPLLTLRLANTSIDAIPASSSQYALSRRSWPSSSRMPRAPASSW